MAVIALTIPDAQLPRVIAALCARGATVIAGQPPVAVPESPANAKAVAVAWIKETVLAFETTAAHAAVVPPDVSTVVS